MYLLNYIYPNEKNKCCCSCYSSFIFFIYVYSVTSIFYMLWLDVICRYNFNKVRVLVEKKMYFKSDLSFKQCLILILTHIQ